MIRDCLAFDGLVKQRQGDPGFQFNNNRWFALAQGNHIDRANFTFHLIALAFQQAFNRQVEVGFPYCGLGRRLLVHGT